MSLEKGSLCIKGLDLKLIHQKKVYPPVNDACVHDESSWTQVLQEDELFFDDPMHFVF